MTSAGSPDPATPYSIGPILVSAISPPSLTRCWTLLSLRRYAAKTAAIAATVIRPANAKMFMEFHPQPVLKVLFEILGGCRNEGLIQVNTLLAAAATQPLS